ncbi:spondin domain-containing protein [Pseudomonas sp. HK3]|jgi:hypothetical protein
MNNIKWNHALAFVTMASVLSACGSGSSNSGGDTDAPTPANYEITLTNVTSNQPLSPVAVLMHSQSYRLWSVGSPASVALETLAEGGANADVLALDDVSKQAMASGAGAIMPGAYETLLVTLDNPTTATYLSVSTMLVNTNDAFTGVTGLSIADLSMGESATVSLGVYDAGTEVNSELVNTIPGQMGEGFNAERTDTNVVSRHPGVVGSDDGHSASVLDSRHKFDNPAAILTVTRVN